MRKSSVLSVFFFVIALLMLGCPKKNSHSDGYKFTVMSQPAAGQCEFSIGGMTTLRNGAVVVETCGKDNSHFVEVNASHGTANWHLISIGPKGDVFDLQKARQADSWGNMPVSPPVGKEFFVIFPEDMALTYENVVDIWSRVQNLGEAKNYCFTQVEGLVNVWVYVLTSVEEPEYALPDHRPGVR